MKRDLSRRQCSKWEKQKGLRLESEDLVNKLQVVAAGATTTNGLSERLLFVYGIKLHQYTDHTDHDQGNKEFK